ncbi:MAG: ATP-dependent DNA helicase, partial [Lachnospiraceae bacterium]
IDRETIERYAAKHTVCPFEFCLDASYWVDGIICDYNYVFDPNVYLKRYFSEGVQGDYIFLIDEAHNLVDRAREMYSAKLLKEDFLKVHKLVAGADKRLASALSKCNKELLTLKRECDNVAVLESIGALALSLNRLYEEFTRFFEEKREFEYSEEVSELFFAVRHFLNMNDHMQDNYVIYTEQTEEGFMIKLYCVNPSPCLSECLDKVRAAVFFSATLLPVMYYKELLSSRDDYAIYVRSPFDRKNRCLAVGYDVTSRYTRRNENEFRKIKNYIDSVTKQKKGNYMVFFPSYGYMESVYRLYLDEEGAEGIYVQSRGMKEQEREEFLDRFRSGTANGADGKDGGGCIGFCVTGGVFSEGIDLKNESLIGCIIVGTGIPQICTERQLLRDYYDAKEGMGYDYAYTYPGMNKVMQAAGRVIRTMEDVGVILLLDERFAKKEYVRLFPEEWDDYRLVDMEQAPEVVAEFWKSVEEKRVLIYNRNNEIM